MTRGRKNKRLEKNADDASEPASLRGPHELTRSGTLPTMTVDWVRRFHSMEPWLPGDDPPWSVVEHYLAYGDEDGSADIEEHALESKAFAYVLEVARSQQEDDATDEEGSAPLAGRPRSSHPGISIES